MRDDPQLNLKWLEQELLDSERPAVPGGITQDTAELLSQVDELLLELEEPEPPVFMQKRKKTTKGERAEQFRKRHQAAPTAAVYTKTRRQLRKERRQLKKDGVNKNIRDLAVLAMLEIIGILCILGWWLQ